MYHPLEEPVVVHTGNPPLHAGGFQDLDLSSAIGARKAFAWIGIQSTNNYQKVAVRGKGDTNNTWPREPDPSSDHYTGATYRMWDGSGGRTTHGFLALTDQFGVTQWKARYSDASLTVKVYGWLDIDDDPYVNVGSLPMDTAWHAIDLSPWVGAQKVLVMLRFRSATGYYPGAVYARPGDLTTSGSGEGASICEMYSRPTDPIQNYVILTTDGAGVVDLRSLYNRAGDSYPVDLIAYSVVGGSGRVLVYSGNCPTVATPLDLSSWVGAKSAFAFLTVQGLTINLAQLRFWQSGDSEPWDFSICYDVGSVHDGQVVNTSQNSMIVPTDDNGVIDWLSFTHTTYGANIYLEGFSESPPNPIAHWPIDDYKDREGTTVRDISEGGSGNHNGVVSFGYYTYWLPGGVGNRNIGPVSQYGGWTTVSNNADDFRINGELSFSIWGACDQYVGWNATILLASCSGSNNGVPANNSPWCFDVTARKLRVYWWDGSWTTVSTTNVVTSRQGFQHFGFVRYEISPGYYGVKFYVDGVMVEDVDNGGAGFAGPTGGESATMYLARRYDFVTTYQSDLWYDSARFYDVAVPDSVMADVFASEVGIVRPELASYVQGIHASEETPEGSIYLVKELSGDSHASEGGQGGDEYATVEVGDDDERTDDVGAYDIIDTGPLSGRAGAGWLVNT